MHHCKTSDTLPCIPILVGTGFAPNPQVIQIIPDTGAEVTVAGLVHLKSLGIKKKHLMLPDHKLSHVAGGTIAVIGKCKLAFEYNQTISIEEGYFVNGISRFFLSRHACKNLYVIPQSFSFSAAGTVNTKYATDGRNTASAIATKQDSSIPFKLTEENIPKLRAWLVDHFKDSVFATNKTPFPVMSGISHRIHLKETAEPFAIHTPIPVAHHWHDEVKQLLDNNAR